MSFTCNRTVVQPILAGAVTCGFHAWVTTAETIIQNLAWGSTARAKEQG